MTELIMISIGMDQVWLEEQLDAFLLTDNGVELDWSNFRNPLPWMSLDEIESTFYI